MKTLFRIFSVNAAHGTVFVVTKEGAAFVLFKRITEDNRNLWVPGAELHVPQVDGQEQWAGFGVTGTQFLSNVSPNDALLSIWSKPAPAIIQPVVSGTAE